MSISLFDYIIEYIIKVTRALQQPFCSVILISMPGQGQQAISRLSAYLSGFQSYESEYLPDPAGKAREARMSQIISQVTIENKPKVMIIQES